MSRTAALRAALDAGEIVMPSGPDARRDLARRLVEALDDDRIRKMLGAVVPSLHPGTGTRTGETSVRTSFRHAPAERTAWEAKAKAAGMKLADWIRQALDERCDETRARRPRVPLTGVASDTYALRMSESERARWEAEANLEQRPLGEWARNALNVAAGL